MKRLLSLFLAACCFAFAGCAGTPASQLTGLRAPETADDYLQYGKALATTANRSIGDAAAGGLASAETLAGFRSQVKVQEDRLREAESLLGSGRNDADTLRGGSIARSAYFALISLQRQIPGARP